MVTKKKTKEAEEKLTPAERRAIVSKVSSNLDEARRLLTEARALSDKLGTPLKIPADILNPEAAETETDEYWTDSDCWGESSDYDESDG